MATKAGVFTRSVLGVLLTVVALGAVTAHAVDYDLDNDGYRDAQFGGSDHDLDNDGYRDAQFGGSDHDLDNDGYRDAEFGGSDHD